MDNFRDYYYRLLTESPSLRSSLGAYDAKFLDDGKWNEELHKMLLNREQNYRYDFSNTKKILEINFIANSILELFKNNYYDIIQDWWTIKNGNTIQCNFDYKLNDQNMEIIFVWNNRITSQGLARFLIKNYYLKEYKSIMSDSVHTPTGQNFWMQIIHEFKNTNKIVIINNDFSEELIDINNLDQYWDDKQNSRIKIYAESK